MKTYKVVVTGPFSAGKTQFIRTASDIDIVTTERRITEAGVAQGTKQETTVAMDYGQRRLGDSVFHLYGTPGQARFEFMWPILSREMDAFVLMVDSTNRTSLMDAMQIVRLFRKRANVPHIVVANKQDLSSALAPDEIQRLLNLPDTVEVVPCVAPDKASVKKVLERIQQMLA